METKVLQTADKLLFVKALYDYSSRATRAKIRTKYAETLNVTERSFRDKMCTSRHFKGEEIDLVESLFLIELGQAAIDNQFTVFLQNMSNADLRTKKGDASFQNLDNTVQVEIDQLKDEMENGQVLISKQLF